MTTTIVEDTAKIYSKRMQSAAEQGRKAKRLFHCATKIVSKKHLPS